MSYEYEHGLGTVESPYQIWTPDDLSGMRDYYKCYYIQMADIDLSGLNWTPITDIKYGLGWLGYYDGNKKTINNLTISVTNPSATQYLGLFKMLDGFSIIEDLTLNVDINVNANGKFTYAGPLCANMAGTRSTSTINNCVFVSRITINDGGAWVGGVTGESDTIRITNSSATIEFESSSDKTCRVGGITAYADDFYVPNRTLIENCCTHGTINAGEKSNVSGFIGQLIIEPYQETQVTIKNSYSDIDINVPSSGEEAGYVSGLIGTVYYAYVNFVNSYYGGSINASGSYVYGIARAPSATFVSTYHPDSIADNGDGIPLSVEQMKMAVSYVGWDFSDIWSITENVSYPILRFEVPPTPLSKVTQPSWTNKVLTWQDVPNAGRYRIKLYNASGEALDTQTVASGIQRYDFTDLIENDLPAGSYQATVQALP